MQRFFRHARLFLRRHSERSHHRHHGSENDWRAQPEARRKQNSHHHDFARRPAPAQPTAKVRDENKRGKGVKGEKVKPCALSFLLLFPLTLLPLSPFYFFLPPLRSQLPSLSHFCHAAKLKGRPRNSSTSLAAGFEPPGASTVSL